VNRTAVSSSADARRFDARQLTPRMIVEELDRYIIGQTEAKRAVAIALRNRWRRMRVVDPMRDEIIPNNIIMIGATGVGKTEIARRLARLAGAPFVKIEATKFTERGYVGRDVDSMIRDLAEAAVKMVREEMVGEVEEAAKAAVEARLLDLLLPPLRAPGDETRERWERSRETLRRQLEAGELEERQVTVQTHVRSAPMLDVITTSGSDDLIESGLGDALKNLFPTRKKERTVSLAEARGLLVQEEIEKRIDMDRVSTEALSRAETSGIVFLDEIDKVASRRDVSGIDVSREGVQRDLLPVVEGSTVQTKYGPLRTDHILFIAAGAFHMSKPSDLIPELQGRFPIRVELKNLTEEDFVRILAEPETSLPRQYQALLATEGCTLEFADDGFREIAHIAHQVNTRQENIGARRLHTIMTTLLDQILFELPPTPDGDPPPTRVTVDGPFVREKLIDVIRDEDLSRYIL
jgi:ATP-dependent HslUV protease ATP-binding subunit HslU